MTLLVTRSTPTFRDRVGVFSQISRWLLTINTRDPDVARRCVILALIALLTLSVSISSAPFILTSGIGDWRLSALFLTTISAFQLIGYYLARRGRIEPGAFVLTFGLSVAVNASPIASDGLNMFMPFAALLPIFLGLLAQPRWILPNIAFNIVGVLIASLAYPGFANGLSTPKIFVPALVLLHIAGGAASWVSARTNNYYFRRLEAANQELARARDAQEIAAAQANSANAAKSSFLAAMSHEVRTPLNAILGYSEIILEEVRADDIDGASLEQDIDAIHSASTHLLALINQMLDLAKIEAGKMTTHITTFDLDALIAELIDTADPLVRARDNTLDFDVFARGVVLETDRIKLKQILLNLLSNAAKFTEHGAITVTATVTDRVLRFAITDTGVGISEEAQAKIFESFVQAKDSTSSDYGGTGLGLALCEQLTALLGGEISVESALGEGTTFTVEFPIDVIASSPSAGAKSTTRPPRDAFTTRA